MFYINPVEIRHHRGDSLKLSFDILEGNNLDNIEYTIKSSDEIYFAILEPNQPWELALVKKKVVGENSIILDPKDTMCIYPGLYYYQFKLRVSPTEVYTLCPRTPFWIQE